MTDDEEEISDEESPSSLSDLAGRLSEESGRARSPTDSNSDAGSTPASADDSGSLSDLADSLDRSDPETDALDEWDLVAGDAEFGGGARDPKTEAILELIGDASNVLLSGPSDSPAEESLGSRLMAARSEGPVNLLVITVTETPSQRLSVLESYLDGPVGETAVVDVRNYNRETNYEQYTGPVDIRPVSSAQDLRRIGIVTSKLLTEWTEIPGETTVCFHSLSDLLALNDDRQRVFRFLHVLRGRVQSADARAHYHLDPSQHEEQTVRTFESLFDTVVEFDGDGSGSLQ